MYNCIIIGPGTTKDQLDQAIAFYKEKLVIGLDTFPPSYNIYSDEIPSVSIYHLVYRKNIKTIFLNARDFNAASTTIKLPQKILIIDREDIINLKTTVKNTEVFIRSKNQIRKAKNAELQSILR